MQLSSEHFELILSSLRSDPSAADEKRARPRVGLRAGVTIVQHAEGCTSRGIRTIATLRDMSREGIGLQHSRSMAIGERFLIQFPRSGRMESLLCTVRRCQQVTRDTFHVGATFVRLRGASA